MTKSLYLSTKIVALAIALFATASIMTVTGTPTTQLAAAVSIEATQAA